MEQKAADSYQSQSNGAESESSQDRVYESDNKVFENIEDLSPINTDIGLDNEENSLNEDNEPDNKSDFVRN